MTTKAPELALRGFCFSSAYDAGSGANGGVGPQFLTKEIVMRALKPWIACALLMGGGIANAEVSSTWTLASDYDFRGVTQTEEDPALQASLDYAHEGSGWYIGAWASNVDYGSDADYEIDVYTGFSGELGNGVGWDAGIIYYAFPGESDLNFPEIYAGLSFGPFQGKLWYSNDYENSDESVVYVDLNLALPLPLDFSLLAHVGYLDGDAIDLLYGRSYVDFAAGFGYTAGNFELALKYVGQDLGRSLELDDRVIFTISTTFPWTD